MIKIKKIEPKIKVKKNLKKIVLEGGAIDVNGRGSILLTRECLLSKVQQRNPGVNKLSLENAFRNNTQGVTAAWSTLESSKSLLRAVQSQVKAAEIANEGISFEYESGLNRSTFDVLQSRSNLINAKINLAEAERNYLLAQYRLLKSAGLLNSEYLKLR